MARTFKNSEWVSAIKLALTALGGEASEDQILDHLRTADYRPYNKVARTPKRSLNMYLNQMNDDVDKNGKGWKLKKLSASMVIFPEIIDDEKSKYWEGAKMQVVVNVYERNLKARQKCLDCHGYNCAVCETSFEHVYGAIGKNFIHVHHLREISDIGSSYKLDPEKDLCPVCPNCHAMLHQKRPCYTVEELKKIINKSAIEQSYNT